MFKIFRRNFSKEKNEKKYLKNRVLGFFDSLIIYKGEMYLVEMNQGWDVSLIRVLESFSEN